MNSCTTIPKNILITGGRSGLGKALAEKLILAHNKIIITSRSFEFNPHLEFKENKIIRQHLDVCDQESVSKFFTWLNNKKININILINNAGIGVFKPLTEITVNEWQAVIATNLTGPFLISKDICLIMKKNNGGRIINIGSIAEKIPLPLNSVYGASKGGLKCFSQILSEELKGDKIRVTHVTLGATYTDIWKERPQFSCKDMLTVNEIAETISYIAQLPTNIRIDTIELLPEKGVL